MTSRITNGRLKEGGRLAVHKQDFNAHVSGDDFRHTAPNIDLNPTIAGVGGTTVQEALESLHDIIVSSGSGFVSIGNVDGYSQGSYNVGAGSTPTLFDAFNAAFDDPRLTNGGVILVMAGTYIMTNTVTVPTGITIVGEVAGTIIIGETPEVPIFLTSAAAEVTGLGGDSGSGDVEISAGSNVDQIRFMNLMLADNLNSTVFFGQATMHDVPMIQVAVGSNVVISNVSFLGRLNDGSVSGRVKTYAAIGTGGAGGTATSLRVTECFMDGVKIGINFVPGNDRLDFLEVSRCKARTYGSEDSGVTSAAVNSFIVMTMCNASITNNYHLGAGSEVDNFLNITAGSPTGTSIVITGNNGAPFSNVASQLVVNTSGNTFTSVQTGNNWGVFVNSPWYIVVGGADNDSPIGDIFGSSAINTILTLASSTTNFQATVVVNPGTYAVNGGGSNFASLKFIGNKIGKNYPVFQMAVISSSTDQLGNRFVTLGNYLESIHFTSTSRFHSVRVGYNITSASLQTAAHVLQIKDCIFTDVGINALDIGISAFTDSNGVIAQLSTTISDCHFHQTGTYSDNLSLNLPRSHRIAIKDCMFTGYGYAANIGTNTYTSSNLNNASITLENVTMDLTGYSIDDASPGAGTVDSYLVISDFFAKVALINCQVMASNVLTAVTPIASGLTTPTATFTKFIQIGARSIFVSDSLFNGPEQTYTTGGSTYAMPAVWLSATEAIKFVNSRVVGGGLPLQVSGPNTFSNSTSCESLIVSNSEFSMASGSTAVTSTLVDVDIDLNSYSVGTTRQGQVVFQNNTFFQDIASSMTQVQHSERTGATYNGQGVVQIYAPFFDVTFSGNKLTANLRQFGTFATPYRYYAGVLINNYDSTTLGSNSSDTPFSVIVDDNIIKCYNFFETNSSSNAAATCVYVKNTLMKIHHNTFNMHNQVNTGGMTQFTGCLWLDNLETTDATYSDAIVDNNIFSLRDDGGDVTVLKRGFITITAASGRGQIINNSFSDTTYDGASTVLVEDNTSTANKWLIFQNKNQTETITIRGNSGQLALGLNSTGHRVASGVVPGITASYVHFLYASTTACVSFAYNDTTADETMYWSVPLYQIVPHGAYITSVSVPVDLTVTPGTTSIATLILRDSSGSGNDTNLALTTSGDTLTVTATQNARPSLPSKQPTVELTMRINGAATTVFTAGELSVTYVW